MSVLHTLLKGLRKPSENVGSNHALNVPKRLAAPQQYGDFALRPLTLDDQNQWSNLRWSNRSWLEPWEARDPESKVSLSFSQWIDFLRQSEQCGSGVVFVMETQAQLVGQISLEAVCYGSMRTATVGYWVDQKHIGHGFAPLAVCMLADWAFFASEGPHLHRIEADILPENERSLRVVRKLGMHEEGIRRNYIFVGNSWRDHLTFSLLSDDCQEGVLSKLSK